MDDRDANSLAIKLSGVVRCELSAFCSSSNLYKSENLPGPAQLLSPAQLYVKFTRGGHNTAKIKIGDWQLAITILVHDYIAGQCKVEVMEEFRLVFDAIMYTCKSMWTLVLGEALQCKTEGGDVQGHYAVANHQRPEHCCGSCFKNNFSSLLAIL